MKEIEWILNHYHVSNFIVLCEMYLKHYKRIDDLEILDLKEYHSGHLGSSTGINFIVSNLNYFLTQKGLSSQLVIGTGHSGAALLAQLWLDGTLGRYDSKYSQNEEGLNYLIQDFGSRIRSEINPQYPETIYDGGELGYSLAVSYGYAMNADVDLVPCIIGDGEAETGVLSSSWYLGKLLDTKSKVLPIINLNGLKMGSESYFSRLSNEEIQSYFYGLGYEVEMVDAYQEENMMNLIIKMQQSYEKALIHKNPVILFRAPKGWGMSIEGCLEIEGTILSHKNPLSFLSDKKLKLQLIKEMLKSQEIEFLDFNGDLLKEYQSLFSKKMILKEHRRELLIPALNYLDGKKQVSSMYYVEQFLEQFILKNETVIFSPDEICSNQLGKLSGKSCFELLNESVLQGLMQGYVQAGGVGILVGYEGFMPILSSMIEQYWKYLLQNSRTSYPKVLSSLNYILTSICWENTYSHQNPSFIDELLRKEGDFCNILYPKDGKHFIRCMQEEVGRKNCINVFTISKRCFMQYHENKYFNSKIEVLQESYQPDFILCASGDIMLKQILELQQVLENEMSLEVKVIYITNPKILSLTSKDSLTEEEFESYFPSSVPCLYLFNGYPNIIKSFLYDRSRFFQVLGYRDGLSSVGSIVETLKVNGITKEEIEKVCKNNLKKSYVLKRRRKNEE